MTCEKWPKFKEIGTKNIKLANVVAKEKNPSTNPAAIYLHKINKNMYKTRLQRDFLMQQMGQSDRAFLLTSKWCPQGVVCPYPGIKSLKNVYKIRPQRAFF